MKKTFLIAAVTFLSISSYATTWSYNCSGGGKVIFTSSDDTTQEQPIDRSPYQTAILTPQITTARRY